MRTPDEIYTSPRLAALYDALNPPGQDTAFYLGLARGGPWRILDIGCGTGQLACAFAAMGHEVTAVDPADAMLAVARRCRGADRVTWIRGDARNLDLGQDFDLAVMTGHTLQVFLAEEDVPAVFRSARKHLPPGGRFAFESRNPLARAWRAWTPAASRRHVCVEGIGAVEVHHRLTKVEGELISFATHHSFMETGETRVTHSTLRFLPQQAIAGHLAGAGFADVEWFGDWNRTPFAPDSPEIIAVAR